LLKKIADTGRENICGKYFRDMKMTLLVMEQGYFHTANIIFANIFSSRIRKNFELYGMYLLLGLF
jgi:hypothetical protein